MKFLKLHKWKFVIAALVVIIAALLLWRLAFSTPADKRIVTVGTPVAAPADQSNTNTQPEKTPTANNDASRNAGGATDTKGKAKATTNSSQWIVSDSGNITVKQPVANATLKSGTTLSGSAKVSQVNYRLSDNQVGVIAQGTLDVVNGSFSGALHFSPQGTGGRLDVFSTNSKGVEFNEIQINVKF